VHPHQAERLPTAVERPGLGALVAVAPEKLACSKDSALVTRAGARVMNHPARGLVVLD
jgi:hypothetical protein